MNFNPASEGWISRDKKGSYVFRKTLKTLKGKKKSLKIEVFKVIKT